MIEILQSIEMITSLYENSFPMRFGVILYSSKLIKQIENNGGEINTSSMEFDNLNEEDLSSLVNFPFSFCYPPCGPFTRVWSKYRPLSTFILSFCLMTVQSSFILLYELLNLFSFSNFCAYEMLMVLYFADYTSFPLC